MASKKRVKEAYCHKAKDGTYTIDMVDMSDRFLKDEATGLTEKEKDQFLKGLREGTNTRLISSSFGLEIYNREPEQRTLHKSPVDIFESYVNNIKEDVKESSYYRHKVANILRNVSDLLDGDAPMGPMDTGVEVTPIYHPDVALDRPGVVPSLAVTPVVSMEAIGNIQDCLDTTIDFDNLTFWFQEQKWHLTKEGFEQTNLPKPKRPTTAPAIEGAMQYMINLLGVQAETTYEEGNPRGFKFVHEGNTYRISHVYTGDHNTIRRDVNLNLREGEVRTTSEVNDHTHTYKIGDDRTSKEAGHSHEIVYNDKDEVKEISKNGEHPHTHKP